MESMEYKGLTIEIEQEECDENPRQWDNFGHMVCFHRQYDLGNKHDIDSRNFSGWNEMREYLVKSEDAVVILPLFLLDHSGLWMRTGTFSDVDSGGWDSGQVGWIYATKADILKEYSAKRLTKSLLAKAESILECEVETFSQYLEGDVWYYVIKNAEGEILDSLGGLFGFDYAEQEAKSAADWQVKHIEDEAIKARQFNALSLVTC